MKIIGLDIGTTSVSGVVLDAETGSQIAAETISNDATVVTEQWKHEQDAERILEICQGLICEFKGRYPDVCRIAITGQMHGIVYVGNKGELLGNLITWQDERGNQQYINGLSYAQYLSKASGCLMSTGFGLTTHFYNTVNHLVPSKEVKLCTIMDYLAMMLCGEKKPLIHISNAASLGLFDILNGRFDAAQIKMLGMEPAVLPELIKDEKVIGITADGIEVMAPIGDNQASTFAVLKEKGDILLNIGTSSQISVACDEYVQTEGLECRPYVGGRYLLLYAGLCGGVSFAVLNDFFRDVCKMFSVDVTKEDVFENMMREAQKAYGGSDLLEVSTLFRGKRSDPMLRGSITNIGINNFTPANLILGFYCGVVEELYDAFAAVIASHGEGRLLLAGNALRNNPLLQRICEEKFGRKAILMTQKEEAARGAAMLAMER